MFFCRIMQVFLLLTFPILAKSPQWFISYSGGYTHYAARDLNDVMVALAEQSAEQGGLNRYTVEKFDGHPRQALTFGALWRGWRIGMEAEFWVETFGQRNVPFYLNRDLDLEFRNLERVHCDMFRRPGFQPVDGGVAGCINAQEIFTIVPLTLQLTRNWNFWKNRLHLGAGYGLGILAGDARILVQTDFIGNESRPDDNLELTLWPGVNLVQKFLTDLEYRPLPALGLGLRGGLRISRMDFVELREKQGDSFLFGLILGEDSRLQKGDRAWLLRSPDVNESLLVIRSEPTAQEKAQANLAGSSYDLVEGDFSGWFIELKLNLYLDLGWFQ